MPDPADDPPLPTYVINPLGETIQPAGDRATQIRLHMQAQEMVEPYRHGPATPLWTCLSPDWLRRHGQKMLFLQAELTEEQNEHIAATLRRHGHHTLIGATADPPPAPPAAVFRFPTTADDMLDFRMSHTGTITLTFPEDRSMALHFDNDYILLAGTPDFLREAVPERDALRARIAEEHRYFSELRKTDWLGDVFRHYAGVMLDD